MTSLTDNEEGIDREKIFVLFDDNSILSYFTVLTGRERSVELQSMTRRTGNRRPSMSYHSQKAYCVPSHTKGIVPGSSQ